MQRTILVVDDDPIYVELVKDLLVLNEYSVLGAHSGEEALATLLQHPIDLIVSDIEMPSLNGIELHRRVRRDPLLKDIPFIFLTGSEESSYRQYIAEHPSTKLVRKIEMVDCLLPCIFEALPQK